MKKKYYIIVALLAISFGLNYRVFGINDIQMPPVKTMKLDNGLSIYYIKDDLPQLTIIVSAGFGRLYETGEQAGLSDLLAKALSLSGSKNFPGVKLYDEIDAIGGKLSINSAWESTVISVKVLKRFAPLAFAIINDLITSPNFNETSVKTAQAMLIEQVKRKFDDPSAIAFEKAREIIFNGNGYGAVPTEKKIASFTLADVNKAWQKYFGAKNIHVGIATSVDFDEIKTKSVLFSGWQAGEKQKYSSDYADIKSTIAKHKDKIFFYPKDIPQATIVVGTMGPDINYKDNYSLEIMNYLLGGGSFNSRLMQEIRVKRGLAYSVGSVIRPRKNTGVFLAYAQVKNENVEVALPIIIENCRSMTKTKIADADLDWAKRAIRNSYIFNFDTPMSIISNYIDIAYNELPADYYATYLSHIDKVTGDSILKASENLFAGGLITVVVGNNNIRDLLKKRGIVEILK